MSELVQRVEELADFFESQAEESDKIGHLTEQSGGERVRYVNDPEDRTP